MSHKTIPISINQAIAFLKNETIEVAVNVEGRIFATIHDYVYRHALGEIDGLNYWEFTSKYERCRLSNVKKTYVSKGMVLF